MGKLKEGIDYYLNEAGFFVFTEKYHRDRGFCCKSGCKHCPYGFKKNNPNEPGQHKSQARGEEKI